MADLEAAGGRLDQDLLWRLSTAVAAGPDAPAPLTATDVRAECNRGWVSRRTRSRGVEVRVTFDPE